MATFSIYTGTIDSEQRKPVITGLMNEVSGLVARGNPSDAYVTVEIPESNEGDFVQRIRNSNLTCYRT